jgi:1-acyl-sn-glycerol-3-phosphate acyltransferase
MQRVPKQHPAQKCSAFAHYFGRFLIKISGWRVEGGVPDSKHMLIIAAPHTSNWDAIFLLGAAYTFGIKVNWLVKNNFFKPVLAQLITFFGGVPVDRSRATNMVTQLADRIRRSDGTNLVVPPAGTRGYTAYWKSGFYRIALEADIPIVCGYLDYSRKVAGLGLSFHLSGDLKQDMDCIREFYEPFKGKYPEHKSRILIREEEPKKPSEKK